MYSTGLNLDFSHLAPNYNADVQVFYGNQNATTQWQKWTKPRGVTMCYMICIAGGGGGGGGFTGVSGSARGGGGSGACSGVATSLLPALFLPDSLVVCVGAGGLGGSGSGVAGGNGTNSYIGTGVGLTAGFTIPNIILESGANAPGGGGAGTGAAAGAAGTVPSIGTKARLGWAGTYSFNTWTVGLVGQLGGAQTGAAGVAVTAVWNTIPMSPGSGGAGVNTAATGFAGGALTLQAQMDHAEGNFAPAAILAGGAAGSAAAAGNGNAGINSLKPFISCGGTGGGSSDGSTGGNGGNGGIGSGGGGGGAGTTGGRGGNGGNGLVVIVSW